MSTDNDVDVSAQVPEADAAEQQIAIEGDASLDLDRVADPSEALDHASPADLIEQKQVLRGEEDYPHTNADA